MGDEEEKLASELRELKKKRVKQEGLRKIKTQISSEKSKLRNIRFGGFFSVVKKGGGAVLSTVNKATKPPKKRAGKKKRNPYSMF